MLTSSVPRALLASNVFIQDSRPRRQVHKYVCADKYEQPTFTHKQLQFEGSEQNATRRKLLGMITGLCAFTPFTADASPEESKMVGAYLRGSESITDFVDFVADKSRTPALRAGVLNPYSIALPLDWIEIPVSNARSGNYCQPRCDEATLEVQFAEKNSGSVQIIIIPTTKLMITKKFPSIEEVGSLSDVLNAISPSITGSVAIEDEEVVNMSTVDIESKTYYVYEALTPFAESGLHNLACVTTNQNYIMIVACSASEKQWNTSEQELRKIVGSFRSQRE